MNPVFRQEFAHDIWDEVQPLLAAHWREIAHYQDIPLEPDQDFYFKIEDAHALRCYVVRVDGQLIGYAAYFVRSNPHYRSSLQASQDVIYIDPAYRKGRLGYQLIKFADEQLKLEGVQVVCQHIKAAHNFGPLLERMGYELQDLIYTKRLDKE